jgi:hypothetical protein
MNSVQIMYECTKFNDISQLFIHTKIQYLFNIPSLKSLFDSNCVLLIYKTLVVNMYE